MDSIRKIFISCLFLLPFFQGLYFYHQVIGFIVIVLLLLIGCMVLNKGIKIERSINIVVLILLTFLYFITCLYGIDKGMSLIGTFKALVYLLFFLLYIQLYTPEYKERLLNTIINATICSAILGILAYFLPLIGQLFIQENRLGGVFQYANTYGLFCMIGLVLIARKKEKKLFEIWGSMFLVVAMILTFSRSILLISAFVVTLTWYLDKENRVKQGSSLISGIVIGITFIKMFGLNEVSTRISEASLHSSEWLMRFIYYKDALNMIKHFPFGTGYEGYSFIQRTYQTGTNYFVKYVHSNILQYALDIGIIGAVLMSTYFISNFLFTKMDIFLKLIFITIVGHGLMDFDFEFPVIFIILLIIVGIHEKRILVISKIWRQQVVGLLAIMSICIYFFCTTLLNYIGEYEKAYALYPYYTEAKIKDLLHDDSITYEKFLLSKEIAAQNKYALEAIAYERDYLYYANKDYEKAFLYAKKSISLNPLNIKHVEIYSVILLEWSREAIVNNDKEQALFCLKAIKDIPNYLDKLANAVNTDYNIKNKSSLKMTELLTNNNQKANESYKWLENN